MKAPLTRLLRRCSVASRRPSPTKNSTALPTLSTRRGKDGGNDLPDQLRDKAHINSERDIPRCSRSARTLRSAAAWCACRRYFLRRNHSPSKRCDPGMDVGHHCGDAAAHARQRELRSTGCSAVTSTDHPDAAAVAAAVASSVARSHSVLIQTHRGQHVLLYARRSRSIRRDLGRRLRDQFCGSSVWLWTPGLDPARLASLEL